MKYLNKFNESSKNEFGIFYIRPVFKDDDELSWLNYSISINKNLDINKEFNKVSDYINKEYSDFIIINMDKSITQPGILCQSNKIEEISNIVFNMLNDVIYKLTNRENCLRMVWGIGEFKQSEEELINKSKIINELGTIHHLPSYPLLVSVGRLLDSEDKPGIFKV